MCGLEGGLNPKPQTLNPKPQTLNRGSGIQGLRDEGSGLRAWAVGSGAAVQLLCPSSGDLKKIGFTPNPKP